MASEDRVERFLWKLFCVLNNRCPSRAGGSGVPCQKPRGHDPMHGAYASGRWQVVW